MKSDYEAFKVAYDKWIENRGEETPEIDSAWGDGWEACEQHYSNIWKEKTEVKSVDLSYFSNMYKVVNATNETTKTDGYALRFYGNPGGVEGIPEFEHIIGLDKNEGSKAYLDYWALRLNRAIIQGWFLKERRSCIPEKDYYIELNRLYNIWTDYSGKNYKKVD